VLGRGMGWENIGEKEAKYSHNYFKAQLRNMLGRVPLDLLSECFFLIQMALLSMRKMEAYMCQIIWVAEYARSLLRVRGCEGGEGHENG
jgi:hypothetical protein